MTCLILAGMPVSKELVSRWKDADYVIAADAGYLNALEAGIEPDLVLGDFDSAPCPAAGKNLIVLPTEKDDTDTYYAAKKAMETGADHIVILGGLGGRLDHTIANLQTLVFLAQNNIHGILADENNEVYILQPGTHRFPARKGWYFSVFSAGEKVGNITLKGVKYCLCSGELSQSYPIGISNEFEQNEAVIRFTSGLVFCVLSRKELKK